MAQLSVTQRLKKVHQRCMNVPGGIKSIAKEMGKVENTLHNWFRGNTTPTVQNVEDLMKILIRRELEAEEEKKQRQQALNQLLA